jgi:hypothetical protein
MDIHAAFEEVALWCAQQTAAGDPHRIEIDCHATVSITISESAPPWGVRWERHCSAGASSPVAQLRYLERRPSAGAAGFRGRLTSLSGPAGPQSKHEPTYESA